VFQPGQVFSQQFWAVVKRELRQLDIAVGKSRFDEQQVD